MKKWIFFVFSIVILFLTLLNYKITEEQPHKNTEQQIAKPHKTVNSSIPTISEKHNSSLSTVNPPRHPLIDPYKENKINEWFHERGYFSRDELSEYFVYDEQALEKLALNHDIKAIQVLALKNIKKGEYNKAHDLYLEAAALGCTYSLNAASSLKMSEHFLQSDAIKKEQLTIDAIALLKVGIMRNDVQIHESYIQTVKDIHRIALTTEQERKVNKKAGKLYKSLEKRRNELNMDHFDNSLPPEMHLFNNFLQPQTN